MAIFRAEAETMEKSLQLLDTIKQQARYQQIEI
jgi:primosomal protein N' (replication factor Y)